MSDFACMSRRQEKVLDQLVQLAGGIGLVEEGLRNAPCRGKNGAVLLEDLVDYIVRARR